MGKFWKWALMSAFIGEDRLCPDPGWLDTHHAPAEEVEYINRKLDELSMKHEGHGAHH